MGTSLKIGGCGCIEQIHSALLGQAADADSNTHIVLLWGDLTGATKERFRFHTLVVAFLVVSSTQSQHLLKIPLIGLNKLTGVGLLHRQFGLQSLGLNVIRILNVDASAECHQGNPTPTSSCVSV